MNTDKSQIQRNWKKFAMLKSVREWFQLLKNK